LPYDGEKSIWAFAKANHELGIINILPEREIRYRIARHPERLSRWLNLDSFLSVFAVVLLTVFIAAHRSKRLLEPFFKLVSAFRSVSMGNFSTRLAFKARGERQMVADAFNAMVLQIEDGIRVRQALEVAQEVQQTCKSPQKSAIMVVVTISLLACPSITRCGCFKNWS
jgi:nitrogen fixation/metabolism regulation signal transduction histidine kinase